MADRSTEESCATAPGARRFGAFCFDPVTRELRNGGEPIELQRQPAMVLALLTSRPGRLVTRGELKRAIWGEATFVDFDQGLNYCIRQLRRALGDSARKPAYVETLPRLGYRFVAGVTCRPGAAVERLAGSLGERRSRPRRGLAIASLLLGLFGFFGGMALDHALYDSALHRATIAWFHGGQLPAGQAGQAGSSPGRSGPLDF